VIAGWVYTISEAVVTQGWDGSKTDRYVVFDLGIGKG
jgi:hypothetical protein